MMRKIQMNKKQLIFIGLAVLVLTLTLTLSGCGREELDLSDKSIVVFELNGGTIDFKTSSTNTRINFAYQPGTKILDPAKDIPNYSLLREGYEFTGWYTSAECLPGDEWDFDTIFEEESLTLYAGWKKIPVYTFALYYTDGDKTVKHDEVYKVEAGKGFDDWKNIAAKREGYTPYGYYSDKELTQKWDGDFKHPGGESDLEIPVYVKYIKGNWALVNDVEALINAYNMGKNIYLLNDIECEGAELAFGGVYTGIFEGNNYTISNFTVNKSGQALIPQCSIFSNLGENSEIRNVKFDNVTYNLFEISSIAKMVKVSALAKSANGAKISNVTITGKLMTDYEGDLSKLEEPFYDDSTAEVSEFEAEITVEKQTQ